MMHITLTVVTGVILLAQAPARIQSQQRPNVSTQAQQRTIDSLRVAREADLARADHAYREILEKTNSQLSLWTNPYGIMIGALGVLFTVGAIVVGVLIFRQGQDYRRLITDAIGEYQRILNTFIEEKNKQIEILKTTVGEKIEALSQELKAADDAQAKEIESQIQQLEQLRKDLKPQELPKALRYFTPPIDISNVNRYHGLGLGGAYPSTSTLTALGRLYLGKEHTCSKCGTVFKAPASGLLGPTTVTCPNCGQKDPAQWP